MAEDGMHEAYAKVLQIPCHVCGLHSGTSQGINADTFAKIVSPYRVNHFANRANPQNFY